MAVISAAFIALPFTLLSFQFLCSLIITSSILRQFIQSLLIYYHIYLNDENDSSAVPAYGEMERSRGSIKSNDSSLYSEINSDEDEHAIEKVWKVTAVGTDESLLRGSFKCYNSVEQVRKILNCHNLCNKHIRICRILFYLAFLVTPPQTTSQLSHCPLLCTQIR